MSDEVVLVPRAFDDGPVDADGIAPARFAAMSEREIARVTVWRGRETAELGELFDVHGGHAARVRIEAMDAGHAAAVDGIGAGMDGGELVIEGSAGDRVGAGMLGGTIVVHGSVGDDAGCGMAGGLLRIMGDAGARLGSATPGAARGMTGGEIIALGAAGADAGAYMRRGLVAIGGDAGDGTGRGMIAGTVTVFGSSGPGTGDGSKRGTVVVMGDVPLPATYRYACTYRPPAVALLLLHLRRARGMGVDERQISGDYRRYCGDLAEIGKGEIVQWTGR